MIFIQSKTGKHNASVQGTLSEIATMVQKLQGYMAKDNHGRNCFIPFHQIVCIREEE